MELADLSQLPAPAIIEDISFESILARRKLQFINEYETEAEREHWSQVLQLESDPVSKLIEESAYNELIYRTRINEAALATMLAYAQGSDLDNIAANFNTVRKLISPADLEANPPIEAIYEADETLRMRAQKAYEGLSVAGPIGAYEYYASAAHNHVGDVKALSPTPAVVDVVVLSNQTNPSPSADVLLAVEKAVNDEWIRPCGDRVFVKAAQIISYVITAKLYVFPIPDSEPILKASRDAAIAYALNAKRIGRDITLSALYRAMHVDGVQRVVITSPVADIVINDYQAAHATAINISIGGTDE